MLTFCSKALSLVMLTFCSTLLQCHITVSSVYRSINCELCEHFFIFSLNVLLVGEECGRLQMYAYGVVHIGTVEFAQHGIHSVSFVPLLPSCFHSFTSITYYLEQYSV